MTQDEKTIIITEIAAVLDRTLKVDEKPVPTPQPPKQTIEMLTIKECANTVQGLSEHTIRQLIYRNEIPYIRTGQGKRGKILIPKDALLSYINDLFAV